MLSLSDTLSRMVEPRLRGEEPASLFEIELETRFNALRNMGDCTHLIVDRLPHPNVEGYDYQFHAVGVGVSPVQIYSGLHNPFITMDLRRDFKTQWEEHKARQAHPQQPPPCAMTRPALVRRKDI